MLPQGSERGDRTRVHFFGAPGRRISFKTHFIKGQAGCFSRETIQIIQNFHPEDQNNSEVMNSQSTRLELHFPPCIPSFQWHQGICCPSWGSEEG